MDYRRVQKEFLSALRGERSQEWVNRRLKKTFNQMYRWEAGLTRILWPDFVELCRVLKRPLKETASRLWGYTGAIERSDLIVRHLVGSHRVQAACAQFGVSRFTLSDWMKGKSAPPLEAIFKRLHDRHALGDFVKSLVDLELNPTLKKEVARDQPWIDLWFDYPWTGAVMSTLTLPEYLKLDAHEDGFVARKVGISIEQEKELLNLLKKSGAIKLKQGKFQATPGVVDIRGNFLGSVKIRSYWVEQGLKRLKALQQPAVNDIYGYSLLGFSEEGYEAVSAAYMDFINRVVSIHEEDKAPQTKVVVMNVQIFDPGTPVA